MDLAAGMGTTAAWMRGCWTWSSGRGGIARDGEGCGLVSYARGGREVDGIHELTQRKPLAGHAGAGG
jgi:hypothetical protein